MPIDALIECETPLKIEQESKSVCKSDADNNDDSNDDKNYNVPRAIEKQNKKHAVTELTSFLTILSNSSIVTAMPW